MDGSFAFAIRRIYHAAAFPWRPMCDLRCLHRPQRTFLILMLATLLTFPNVIFALLSGRQATAVMGPHALYAASRQSTAACQELLTNGDLETSGGWRFGATPVPGTVVDTPAHAGSFALRLGIGAGNNTLAYSTAYQTVALPATAEQIVLTYWERPGATGDSGDYREVVALRTDFTVLRSLERQTGGGNDQWTQRTFDVTDLRGQSLVLYFNVYNNGSGAILVNYLDDISLQSCDSAASATPTTPPAATSTPTPTPTTIAVATLAPPTSTATATPLPSDVIVRAGIIAVAEGQTTVAVPLDLIGATAARAVGVMSVDVQYNATLLKAVTCAVGDSFDLLLCNTDTPGVISVAGVAAAGLRTDVQIANVSFEVLQPANLSTQLTVQLNAMADAEGSALRATGQHGQVGAACPPGRDDCQTLFLPLVHR